MLKIYPQGVDSGSLPFVLNNLGNLGSVKQGCHKLPRLTPLSPNVQFFLKKRPVFNGIHNSLLRFGMRNTVKPVTFPLC